MGIFARSPEPPKTDPDGKHPPKEGKKVPRDMILQDMTTPKGRGLMIVGIAALAVMFGVANIEHIKTIIRGS